MTESQEPQAERSLALSEHLAEFALAKVSPRDAGEAYRAFFGRHDTVTLRPLQDWEEMVRFLSPLRQPIPSRRIAACVGEWTLMLANVPFQEGFSTAKFISKRAQVESLAVSVREDARSWSLNRAGKTIRLVQLLRDSTRWVFSEEGETLPFEDRSTYAQVGARRLPVERVWQYLAHYTGLSVPFDWPRLGYVEIVGIERAMIPAGPSSFVRLVDDLT